MQVGNRTYFSPRRYKTVSGTETAYMLIDKHGYVNTHYRKYGPAIINNNSLHWFLYSVENRKDGASYIVSRNLVYEERYYSKNINENCGEETYWNS